MSRIQGTVLALGLTALMMMACGSDSPAPPTDTLSDTGADVTFPDTCQCQTAAECEGKVNVTMCTVPGCSACQCVAAPKVMGTQCDDGNVATVGDACNDKGQCVGTPTSCKNSQCEPNENCGNCIEDCPCAADEFCDGVQCKKAVCGNIQCEAPVEDCENCVNDCGCEKGKTACHEKSCTACADYCTTTGKECCDTASDPECNQSKNCNCGQCLPGYKCDGFNQCYSSDICNNGKCEESENCENCAADCGCLKEEKCLCSQFDADKNCLAAECKNCGPICEAADKDCGFYEGCDCGSCQVCYSCSQNQCNPKCDCVCWQKECGVIGDCKCGPLEGLCPGAQDCNAFKCLENCDTLCSGVACGWAGDCFCAECGNCEACNGNQCGPGSDIDEYDVPPYNDYPTTATDMGTTTDSNTTSAKEFSGTIDVDFDADWYKVEVQDVAGQFLTPHVELKGLDEDKDLDLEVCFLCKEGELAVVLPKPADMIYETESTIPGARCFVSMLNLWGQDELLELGQLTCDGDPQDDSGTVYVHVYPAFPSDCGASYTISWWM
ncbi:MAG: hypothetical protein ISR64_09875 [Deltaproteobacteria bacterium]|nr:hypothetical protein [Deltaproteobacteria bacterium]